MTRSPIILLLTLCCLLPSFAVGQDVTKWRAGSARQLEGLVRTYAVFVSDTDADWKEEEKRDILNKLDSGTRWLTQQAARLHINLQFEVTSLSGTGDVKLHQMERGQASGNERVDLVSLVLAKAGWNSPLQFYGESVADASCANIQVLLFAKGKGTGYSMAFSNEMNPDMYFVEGAILYEQYWNDYKLTPASIAHEILHLYGAWDLYKTFQQSQEKEDRARQLFPDSIMLRTSFHIRELYVDEVTAWLVGWHHEPKDWYRFFHPDNK